MTTEGIMSNRKPHEHQFGFQRYKCVDPECRKPFKLSSPPVIKRTLVARERVASREEQHSRYLDCGPQAWDDKD